MKKIVLVSAINKNDFYHSSAVNLGILYLEAYLAKHSKIKVVPTNDIESAIEAKPDMIGISSVTETYGIAIKMAKEIKSRLEIPVIIGGVHISTLPESLDKVFDAGIIGEGEETLLELAKSYPNIDDIKGLVFYRNGKIVKAPRRPQIEDLDFLPMPNRKRWLKKLGIPFIMTTRGCIFKCAFCASPVHWGTCRRFSPERVLEEIKDLRKNWGVRFIRFFDDIFTLDKRRLARIVGLIRSNELEKKITFGCFSRVGIINKEIVSLLKKGNIKFVGIGLESASEKVLGSLKDRPFSIEASQSAIDIIYRAGLNVNASFIVGTPNETEADLKRTLRFLERNLEKILEVEINPIVPNPSTKIWDYALKKGLVSLKMDWSRIKDHSFLIDFDPDRYIYLNERIPYKTFLRYIDIFKDIYRSITLSKRNLSIMRYLMEPKSAPVEFKQA